MKTLTSFSLVLSFIALCGCGQTGPLYLPSASQHAGKQPTPLSADPSLDDSP